MRKLVLAALAIVVTACIASTNLDAQTVGEDQQAVLVFDLNVQKLKSSKIATLLGLDAKLAEMAADQEAGKPDPQKLLRVVGAMSAPKSIAEAQLISEGQMPIDFYARMQFENSESVDKLIASAEEEGGTKFEREGKTYYKPADKGETPPNLVMHRVDGTTVEMGTEGYVFLPNRDVLSAGLQEAWAKTGDDAIRLAIDIEGAAALVAEAVAMGKAQAKGSPGEAQTVAYLGLIDNMKNLRLSIDLEGDNLILIEATGVDESNAQELQGGLNSLLGMGKMFGGMQLAGLKEQDPEAAAVAGQIVEALDAAIDGNEVSVKIPHPEGLEGLVQKFAPMMGMPGAGSAGPRGGRVAPGNRPPTRGNRVEEELVPAGSQKE